MPSRLSSYSAPSSVYVSPISRVIVPLQFKLIIGGVVSTTLTVLLTVKAGFPAVSV